MIDLNSISKVTVEYNKLTDNLVDLINPQNEKLMLFDIKYNSNAENSVEVKGIYGDIVDITISGSCYGYVEEDFELNLEDILEGKYL